MRTIWGKGKGWFCPNKGTSPKRSAHLVRDLGFFFVAQRHDGQHQVQQIKWPEEYHHCEERDTDGSARWQHLHREEMPRVIRLSLFLLAGMIFFLTDVNRFHVSRIYSSLNPLRNHKRSALETFRYIDSERDQIWSEFKDELSENFLFRKGIRKRVIFWLQLNRGANKSFRPCCRRPPSNPV